MNSLNIRAVNRKKVLNYLYENRDATKQIISKSLNLSLPTVSFILRDLADLGLVTQTGTLKSSGGRKPVAITLNYNAKYSAGIAVTQNCIRLAVINLGEEIIKYKNINVCFENTDAYFAKLAESLDRFLRRCKIDQEQLLGVGIALPGLVTTDKRILEYSPTLQIHRLPIQTIAHYIPYPVLADNEANLAGLAEIWHINDVKSAVFLSINKGVGGAVVIHNKIFSGANGHAGEFGHMTIVKDGLTCSCGKKGCLEAYCSTNILTDSHFSDLENFFSALVLGNRYCIEKWNRYLDFLAVGINNIHTIFDCDLIIGGEISKHLPHYTDVLNQKLCSLNSFGEQPNYLHYSKYYDAASAVGAALLFINRFLGTESAPDFPKNKQ
ncbi:MAG: ROK family transcriptional regulator [Oscillospiraceae bacterium]|nr:ROK family transcriptional regulator [Oscillospiraceae bacterium]